MNGGPAFPVTKPKNPLVSYNQYTGMTILDWFAGQAMSAIRSKYVVDTANMARIEQEIAELAYCQARAMLEVRRRIKDVM